MDRPRPDEVPAPAQPPADAWHSPATVSLVLTGLFVLACFYTLYLARSFVLPVVLALLLNFLLSPIVRTLAGLRIPRALAAGVVVLSALFAVGFIGYQLSAPVADWVRKAPEIVAGLRERLEEWKGSVQEVTGAAEEVGKLAEVERPGQAAPQVAVREPGIIDFVFGQTFTVLFGAVVMVILLYFLLASGDLFLRKLVRVLPRFEEKKRAVEIAREIEHSVSRYLFTYALINTGLGTVGALAFWLLGLPNPLLWGVFMGLANFVPYLGALTTATVVGLVGAGAYDVGHGLLAAGVSLGINSVEGYLLTPWIMGQRMLLNPVMIFIGLTFWGWLWGVPGALLAVPILVTLKIICDRIEPLAPVGEFLGRE